MPNVHMETWVKVLPERNCLSTCITCTAKTALQVYIFPWYKRLDYFSFSCIWAFVYVYICAFCYRSLIVGMWFWEANLGLLKEKQVLLFTELSLQPQQIATINKVLFLAFLKYFMKLIKKTAYKYINVFLLAIWMYLILLEIHVFNKIHFITVFCLPTPPRFCLFPHPPKSVHVLSLSPFRIQRGTYNNNNSRVGKTNRQWNTQSIRVRKVVQWAANHMQI